MKDIPRDIIEKAASGDIRAFEEVYKAYSSIVYTVAFNITRNAQDAEEATQDVFVKVYRKLQGFKFESSFGTWIYRIAANTAINIYHSRARRKEYPVDNEEIARAADPGAEAKANDELERESAGSKISRLLGVLSPEHRSCIVLREIEGLDYKEIADALKIPLNTVRSRIKRAREAMVSCAKEGGVSYGL